MSAGADGCPCEPDWTLDLSQRLHDILKDELRAQRYCF